MSKDYWENVWSNISVDQCEKYASGYKNARLNFIDIFKDYGVKNVCDAACGFGGYTLGLSQSGFNVSFFDISSHSIEITKEILLRNSFANDKYKVCDLCNIEFDDNQFDGVVCHAAIDHLSLEDGKKALKELLRIIKPQGLIYLSFDPLEEEDLNLAHQVLEDGSFLYTSDNRKSLLFKYYHEEEIDNLIKDQKIILRRINKREEREVIIQK